MNFNGIDFSEDLRILEINRPLIPDILTYTKKIPGKDGVRSTGKSELAETLIEVKVELKDKTAGNLEDFFRKTAGQLFTKEESKLTFKREPGRYYMAKLEGSTDFKQIGSYGIASLQFKSTSPFAYGAAEQTKSVNVQFTNKGTYESYGVIELTAPTAANLEISNGDKILELKYSFTGTQTIVVDLEKERITMNGASAMKYLTLESDFFTIPSGTAKITTNGTGTIKYKERWL